MKKQFLLLIIFILNTFICNFCFSETKEFPSIGIVTASKLMCRKDSSSKSAIITSFNFSTPIVLIDKSKQKQTINGLEGYWYQEQNTKGWVFGAFLFITIFDENKLSMLKAERIRCNVSCGGNSCFYQFEPLLIGEYYIAHIYMSDYPCETSNSPANGFIIGKYKISNDSIVFEKALKLGGYNINQNWINGIDTLSFETKEYFSNYSPTFYKVNDKNGDYYISNLSEQNISRESLQQKCKEAITFDEIWFEYNTTISITIEECRIYFKNKIR